VFSDLLPNIQVSLKNLQYLLRRKIYSVSQTTRQHFFQALCLDEKISFCPENLFLIRNTLYTLAIEQKSSIFPVWHNIRGNVSTEREIGYWLLIVIQLSKYNANVVVKN